MVESEVGPIYGSEAAPGVASSEVVGGTSAEERAGNLRHSGSPLHQSKFTQFTTFSGRKYLSIIIIIKQMIKLDFCRKLMITY